MKATEELNEISKSVYFSLERLFKMISAGINTNFQMYGGYGKGESRTLFSDEYTRFQACIKIGEKSEAFAAIVIKKDGSGNVAVGVNLYKTDGRYTSTFFGKDEFSKELLVIEYFLKRNLID